MILSAATELAEKPLFIALKRKYFEAFARREKTYELRQWGHRWNSKTCRIGRRVVLSLGYGKRHRLTGTITGFEQDRKPEDRPEWVAVYGDRPSIAAVIHIALDQ
jgi:hypothetical protein